YSIVPSPNSHLFIARTLTAMGETRNAYLEYDKVIAEAHERSKTEDRFKETEQHAREERDSLSPRIGLLNVMVTHDDPSTKVGVGGHEVPRDYWGRPFPVDPSTVDVRVQTQGRPAVVQTVTIAGNERKDVTLDATGPAVAQGPGPGTKRSGISPLRAGAF